MNDRLKAVVIVDNGGIRKVKLVIAVFISIVYVGL